jgi:hypothetical protein
MDEGIMSGIPLEQLADSRIRRRRYSRIAISMLVAGTLSLIVLQVMDQTSTKLVFINHTPQPLTIRRIEIRPITGNSREEDEGASNVTPLIENVEIPAGGQFSLPYRSLTPRFLRASVEGPFFTGQFRSRVEWGSVVEITMDGTTSVQHQSSTLRNWYDRFRK